MIWDNICTGGYAGRLYAVNPHAGQIGAEPCLASAADLPEHVDLAVIAVPQAAVLNAAEQCGRRGVHALVVITSGLDAGHRAGLLATCRRYGMRLIGPNCFGVAVPSIGLDTTFAAARPRAGVARRGHRTQRRPRIARRLQRQTQATSSRARRHTRTKSETACRCPIREGCKITVGGSWNQDHRHPLPSGE